MDAVFFLAQLSRRDAPPTMMVAAVPPPPGVKQDFINPPISAADAPVFVGIGLAIAGLLLLVRIYTKGFLLRKFGPEDVAILLAFICSTACCILILEGRVYGTGRHIWDVPVTTLVPHWGKIVTAAVVMYCPAMMFAKIAVLLCYLRISPQFSFRLPVYIMIGIVVAYNVALMLSLVFACRPIAKNWDATITTGSCINRPAVYLANGVLNIITDFAILLLPLPMIRSLHMPSRQKILLAAFFTVGSLACIVSIIRLRTLIPTLHNPDQTWAIASPGNWIIIEMNLAVSCGCLSVIRPFLRHHFPILMGESRNTRDQRYNKAKPSDYFSSKRTPNSGGRDYDSHGSKAQLSQSENRALASWDANTMGYSHEAKASGGEGHYIPDDDLELGDLGQTPKETAPVPRTADVVRPAPVLKGGIGTPRGGGSGRFDEDATKDRIMKTVEVNIQR